MKAGKRRVVGFTAIIGLVIAGGALWWMTRGDGGSGEGPVAAGARNRATAPRERADLDTSVIRANPVYGFEGESHASLDLALRVVRSAGGELEGISGATLVLDDEPLGISDAEGRLAATVPISDAGTARRIVWAELGDERSMPVRFSEVDWPDDELTLLLAATGNIRGQVLGADGQPARGASVAVEPPVAPPQVTDAAGRFELRELPPGQVTLEAWHEGAGLSVPARVVAKETADIVLRLETLGAVSGTVVDEAEAPVEGASVTLFIWEGEHPKRARRDLSTVTSDAEGHFSFPATTHLELDLTARKGNAYADRDLRAPYEPIQVQLQLTGVVTGQVRYPDGTPARGASVVSHNPMSKWGASEADYVNAQGADATYRLQRVTTDTTELWVAGTGQSIYQVVPGLVVVSGEEVTFDLTLEGVGVDRAGQVKDAATGQGVEGVELEMVPVVGNVGHANANYFAISDADGRFVVKQTDAEMFIVRTKHPKYRDRNAHLPADALVIELTRGRRVTGRVVNDTHEPLANFSVDGRWVYDVLGSFDTSVDETRTEVVFFADGYQDRTLPLPEGDSHDFGTVVLQPAEVLSVVVEKSDGTPAAGAMLHSFKRAWDADMMEMLDSGNHRETNPVLAVTSSDGRARVPLLPEGYCLGAHVPGLAPSREAFCADAQSDTREARLKLAPSATVEGDAGGPGRRVSTFPGSAEVQADESGHYRITGQGWGWHTVYFDEAPGEPEFRKTRPVELFPGQTARVDLEDPNRGSLRVTVRGDTHENVYVHVSPIPELGAPRKHLYYPGDKSIGWGGLREPETYEFDGLVAGPTRVVVRVRYDNSNFADVVVKPSETVEVTLDAPKIGAD